MRIVIVFVIVNIKAIFSAQCIVVRMVHLCIKFKMADSSTSFVTVIKTVKEKCPYCCHVVILKFTRSFSKKVTCWLRSFTIQNFKPRLWFPASHVRTCDILLQRSCSFYWTLAANDPNVLIVLPLDVPDLTASLLLRSPSDQRWRRLWTFLFSNVPTFATSGLQDILEAKSGTTWARNDRWILPGNARLPRNIQGSFTCLKSTTLDRRLYFPSEGRRAEDFFALKNLTASAGFEPANLGTKGQHATSRPSKLLT